MEIVWKDNIWIVRGVVKEPPALFMVQASGIAGQISFDRINVKLPEGGDRRITGKDFINRHGLYASVLRWDYLYNISWFLELVPGTWSDFDSWKENFKEHGKAVELVRNTGKTAIEAEGLSYYAGGIRFITAGVFLLMTGSAAGFLLDIWQGFFYALCQTSFLQVFFVTGSHIKK